MVEKEQGAYNFPYPVHILQLKKQETSFGVRVFTIGHVVELLTHVKLFPGHGVLQLVGTNNLLGAYNLNK